MWRLMLVVGVVGLGLAACGDDEVDVEEFYRRLSALGNGTFTVTYEMETITKSETEVRDLVWYHDRVADFPLPLERVDLSGDFGFIARISGPIAYACGGEAGVERLCSVDGRRVSEPEHWFVRPTLDRNRATVIDSWSERIAGYEAECYEIETDPVAAPYATHEMCLSEDGLLLFGETGPFESPDPDVAGMVISMIAIEAKTEVADDAFEPPYPVIDRTGSQAE